MEPTLNGEDSYPGDNYPYLSYQSLDGEIWMEVNSPDGQFFFNITYYADFTKISKFNNNSFIFHYNITIESWFRFIIIYQTILSLRKYLRNQWRSLKTLCVPISNELRHKPLYKINLNSSLIKSNHFIH